MSCTIPWSRSWSVSEPVKATAPANGTTGRAPDAISSASYGSRSPVTVWTSRASVSTDASRSRTWVNPASAAKRASG